MKPLAYYATERIDARTKEDKGFYNFIAKSLARFSIGDWGDICEEDKEINDTAVKDGTGMILGSYKFMDEETVWIIKDDASLDFITILYPEER